MTTARRDWLFKRQHGRCYLCHGVMLRPAELKPTEKLPDDVATRDHVLPRSAKAKGEPSLILLACRRCNTEKGATAPTLTQVEFAQLVHREWIEARRELEAEEREAKAKNRAHRARQAVFDENAKAAKRRRRTRKRYTHQVQAERAR